MYSPSKEHLRDAPKSAPKQPKAKSEGLPNKLFFRLQSTFRWKKREIVVRLSNERPFGIKYSGWSFLVPKFHRNTSSFRFGWLYVSLRNR